MISDFERREVAKELRNVFGPYGVPKSRYISLPDVLDALGIYYDSDVDVHAVTEVKDVSRLADLIDRQTCKYVSLGDRRAGCSWCRHVVKLDYYVPVANEAHMPFNYCPKCGKEISDA